MPEPPPRPSRPAFADEVRRPPRAERGADPLGRLCARTDGRPFRIRAPSRRAPRMPRSEPDDAASRAAGRSAPKPPRSRSASRGVRRTTADATIGTCDVLGGSESRRDGATARGGTSTAPEAKQSHHRLRRNRPLPAPRPPQRATASPPCTVARRAASTISKTKWPRCSAARRILREGRRPSA